MGQAKDGDAVKLHYTGSLESGTVFDTSKDGEPFEFTLGSGTVIPGFEKGIIGIEVGETNTITLQPEQASGPRHQELKEFFEAVAYCLAPGPSEIQNKFHGVKIMACPGLRLAYEKVSQEKTLLH